VRCGGAGGKATMRVTAPGTLDTEHHDFAMHTELEPQVDSIQSPEFASRLAAVQAR